MTTGVSRKIAAFPAPRKYPDRSYDNEQKDCLPTVAFLENDLVVRRSLFSGYYDGLRLQIMDADSGRIVEGNAPAHAILSGASIDSLFLYDRSASVTRTFKLVLRDNYFLLIDAQIPNEVDGLLQHLSCFQDISEETKLAIWEQVKERAEFSDSRIEFKNNSNSVLITIFVSGSSGIWRDDRLFDLESGEEVNSVKLQEEFSIVNPSRSDFTWVGVREYPTLSYWSCNSIDVLFNRDAVMKSSDSVKLHFRHPTVPTHARFMSHDHLVVVDAEHGRLWAHDFGERLRRRDTLFSTPTSAIIGNNDPIETLQHGTCIGYSIPLSVRYTLQDGSYIYYDTGGITHGSKKHELRVVSGDNTTVIQLNEGSHCITISADWNRLLVLKRSNIDVYDFDRVLKCKALAGGKISTILITLYSN